MRDVIIVGSGHNGLVTAALLAKAGMKPLVLERADRVGGCAVTSTLAPGFRCPTLAHAAAIDPAIVRALGLARHGLRIIRSTVAAHAPTGDGRALTLWTDAAKAAENIAPFSARDATRYHEFLGSVQRIGSVLRIVLSTVPPAIDEPSGTDLFEMLKAARAFHRLPKADAYRLLRWMPMAIADFVDEWFESEPLRATVASSGILGSSLGVRSAGSTALMLLLAAGAEHPIANGWQAEGGTGAIADALAGCVREAGGDIRTGAEVVRISVTDGAVDGVTLSTGEDLAARVVVSGLDPKRTFLRLVDPMQLGPEFVRRAQNIRASGTLAKINYAVSSLPAMAGARDDASALSGRIRLNRETDAIERAFDAAKYGGVSDEPWMELTIPSINDPSLAPSGCHVVSAYLQYAPYSLRGTTWDAERDRLGRIADRTIARYAPGFEASIVARQVITPVDLERTFGLTGGHIFHGELSLDQLFVARPLLGWARYATPVRNLYLCGSGTHPGTGLNGRSGALAARQILRELEQ